MNKDQFVTELGKLRPSATFLTLHGYRSESGEIADYNIVFHMSYENALKRSIAALESYVPEDDLCAIAQRELIDSYKKSLNKIALASIEERDEAYCHFTDANGNYIKGVKLHIESDTLHLYGFVNGKRITTKVPYSKGNKKPLTIAKDKLRKMCPVDKFRQFKIAPGQIQKISVENLSLLAPI